MSKYANLVHSAVSEKIEVYLIENGLAPGDRLPPEREFCELLGVSRMTLRQAMHKLEEAGVLAAGPGRGTFVAAPRICKELMRFPKLGEDSYKLISIQIQEAMGTVARVLRAAERTEVYQIKRLRRAGDTRVSIETSYIPVPLMGRMDIEYLEILPVHIIYGSRYENMLTRSDIKISIGQATFEESEWLGIAEGDYVTIEKHTVFNEDTPMEYCVSVSAATRVCYHSYLSQEEVGL